jgi:hypothetical protein
MLVPRNGWRLPASAHQHANERAIAELAVQTGGGWARTAVMIFSTGADGTLRRSDIPASSARFLV